MTVRRLFTQRLIGPEDVPPTRPDFEVVGAFNPGAARVGGEVVLLVRVAERPRERRAGFTALPRWEDGAIVVDWVPVSELEPIDPRVVKVRATGLVRLTFTSHLRVVRLAADGRAVREVTGVTFRPEGEVEEFGVEDPRVTPLDGRFVFTYVAVSRHGPATAVASTADLRTFTRHGVAFCPENKDVVLFPERVGGEYACLHRPVCGTPFTRPEMWAARSPDLLHWGRHAPLALAGAAWQSGRVGAGCPPVRVDGGWLELYHGNRHPTRPGEVGEYTAGLLLLDADDPSRVRKWTAEPVMVPEAEFERTGFVGGVVFPTGIVEAGDEYLVYSGAADAVTGVVGFGRGELLAALG
ncbi:MAG: glycosylase [Isosphaera sp.]|nr:glycosylase [Isosphaera sp.]